DNLIADVDFADVHITANGDVFLDQAGVLLWSARVHETTSPGKAIQVLTALAVAIRSMLHPLDRKRYEVKHSTRRL
ncbi:MAG: hypothetical protein KDI03_23865, partial [Anaerolineae bacterium]|nr:hypothetical protein [Anaerolineae bacterium]